ncbi:MAG TPA: hypothetical protein VMV18_09065 [bacterium]|nr:hypothetical protein [bacterium]
MRIDVLDLGSNTFHLASFRIAETLRPLASAKAPTRLGEHAFQHGFIDDRSARRALESIGRLLAEVRPGREEERLVAIATGVFRDATNAGDFLASVRRRYGIDVQILSGEAEAELTYAGVRSEMPDPDARLAVFDLGGGSLEIACGRGERVSLSRSLPMGVLRMNRRWRDAADGTRLLRDAVRDAVEPMTRAIRRFEPDEIVFSAGTARALLRLARRLEMPEDVPGCLGRQTLFQLAMLLTPLDADAVESLGVPASRADTIGTGAVILSTVVELMQVPFVRIARRALREGVALAAADQKELRGLTWISV